MGYLIGADIGSQSVKAVLLDPEGRTVASAGQGCAMLHPANGWAEQDPADWQTGLTIAVRQLITRSGIAASDVTHLGLASQVDGVVPVDGQLQPLRPGIIWLDRRATGQAAALSRDLGPDRIFATTGLNTDASHIAPKLMWLREHEPDTFRQARCFPPVGGYMLGWLTGELAQDHANASSTLLYDVQSGTWDDGMLEATGLDPGVLAEIRPSAEVVGTLTAEAAADLGLSRDAAVVVGTGDEHAACVGAGAVVPGLVADVTGTAEPVAATAPAPVFDAEHVVETHAHAITGLLLVENPGFVSGGCTLWCANSMLGIDQAGLFELAARAPAGADGVLFVPALSGATVPRWNDRMRGVFAGLSMNHDRTPPGPCRGGGLLVRAARRARAAGRARPGRQGDPGRRRRGPQRAVAADQGRRDGTDRAARPGRRADRARRGDPGRPGRRDVPRHRRRGGEDGDAVDPLSRAGGTGADTL